VSKVHVALAAMVAAMVAHAGPARADDDAPEQVHVRLVERGDWLTMSTKINKLFDNAAYAALDSGFVQTVIIRMWVYPQGGNEPIAFTALERHCVRDMWADEYDLLFVDQNARTKVVVKRHADALEQLTDLSEIQIAQSALLPYEQVFQLAIEAELNPVSKETQAEVRRWLSRGAGNDLDHNSTFFGSFVSVFVNSKLPDADRVLRLRSQTFFRPKPVQ
jgi:hypothetical protein